MPDKEIFQYAVKVIQGKILDGDREKPIGPGIYFTSVNVHNPWRHKVAYWTKLAVAGHSGRSGDIRPFQPHDLGPDAVTEYTPADFANPPIPSFLEGYFVIESEEELDVVGVYTGAAVQDKHLGAMHMERVPARRIPRCKDLNLDISSGVASWQIRQVPAPTVASSSTLLVGPAPVISNPPNTYAHPSGTAKWIGTASDTSIGDYSYEVSFCLCPTFRNAQLTLNLWADNEAKLYLNGSLLASTPPIWAFKPENVTNVSITNGFVIGINTIKVVVKNILYPENTSPLPSPSGMMLDGTVSANAADCLS